MNVRTIGIGVEAMDDKAREFYRIKDKLEEPMELIRIIRRSSFKGRFKFYQILNTGFEKSIDEVKHNSLKLLQALKGAKNVVITPFLIQPWPGSDAREIFIKNGFKVAEVTRLNLEKSGVCPPHVSEEQLNNWALEYDLLLRKHGQHSDSHSFFWGLVVFVTSSIRPITKLKILWAIFSYYVRVRSAKDPSRMRNSTKKFF